MEKYSPVPLSLVGSEKVWCRRRGNAGDGSHHAGVETWALSTLLLYRLTTQILHEISSPVELQTARLSWCCSWAGSASLPPTILGQGISSPTHCVSLLHLWNTCLKRPSSQPPVWLELPDGRLSGWIRRLNVTIWLLGGVLPTDCFFHFLPDLLAPYLFLTVPNPVF